MNMSLHRCSHIDIVSMYPRSSGATRFSFNFKIFEEPYSYEPKIDNVCQKSLKSISIHNKNRSKTRNRTNNGKSLDNWEKRGWEIHKKKAGAQTAMLIPPMTMKTCFTP